MYLDVVTLIYKLLNLNLQDAFQWELVVICVWTGPCFPKASLAEVDREVRRTSIVVFTVSRKQRW